MEDKAHRVNHLPSSLVTQYYNQGSPVPLHLIIFWLWWKFFTRRFLFLAEKLMPTSMLHLEARALRDAEGKSGVLALRQLLRSRALTAADWLFYGPPR